jgi:hypothetical protein
MQLFNLIKVIKNNYIKKNLQMKANIFLYISNYDFNVYKMKKII